MALHRRAARPVSCALQDFKTAHLLGVCPRAQFLAMLMGSAASALVSVGAYSLYTSAWPVPGPEFPAPTAEIWLDMADLVSSPSYASDFVSISHIIKILISQTLQVRGGGRHG